MWNSVFQHFFFYGLFHFDRRKDTINSHEITTFTLNKTQEMTLTCSFVCKINATWKPRSCWKALSGKQDAFRAMWLLFMRSGWHASGMLKWAKHKNEARLLFFPHSNSQNSPKSQFDRKISTRLPILSNKMLSQLFLASVNFLLSSSSIVW